MSDNGNETPITAIENQEWIDSIDYILENEEPERAREILGLLQRRAAAKGVAFSCPSVTPYLNTIPADQEEPFPGNREIERRLKSLIRWNAMAMVVKANRNHKGLGGHISSFASVATLWEVGFNHFFKGKDAPGGGDTVYFQGHAAPGVYARAFLEGRLSREQLENFRQETADGGGLSSYPHPRLMPDFWEFPTVSMGLSPISAIYQARFYHYLQDRGIKDTSGQHIWAFLGDGEMDEPESLGAITLASREKLDNLTFVINCNLQRLDGPVRGNGQVIKELEAAFRGAGWNVIKVIWGSDWDELLQRDHKGILAKYLDQVLDGWNQKFAASSGAYIREQFFGQDPELLEMVKNYSDEQLQKMRRGGHDPVKVYNAYKAALEHKGAPTVILAQTIKGYGLGESGEGKNITHQQKKLNEEELRHFRSRFDVPLSDEEVGTAPLYKPEDDSEELAYLHERRRELGGYLPERRQQAEPLSIPREPFEEFLEGSGEHPVSTTMAYVQILGKLLKNKSLGKLIVPIVPDEARTFGMEALFRQFGIYSHIGQLYEPVDRQSLLYYREATDGVIIEEGITEAGSLATFIAAGTSYATQGINMIPFFSYYSMFGFQRIGDLAWSAGDARAKGFLMGGTSGRTTLPGEGLQHQDGQSHLYAFAYPSIKAYDPAYAYEMAVIIEEGLRRMYEQQEDWIYYITMMNETYVQPPMPEGVREGILRGLYKLRPAEKGNAPRARIMASGAIVNEALQAAELLESEYGIGTDVWSATSFKELYTDAVEAERHNRLQAADNGSKRQSYLQQVLESEVPVTVAATDYLKAVASSIAPWMPGTYIPMGTDGYGLSETREALREHFEVNARHLALAVLQGMADRGEVSASLAQQARQQLPMTAGRSETAAESSTAEEK
jgi:pyruvate dehydrogenase E1 component